MFEGRFGLFALHRQDETAQKDFARIDGELGTVWESRRGSFKPFPAAHVIHPYLDAILRLRREHGINPAAVARIVLPIAPYILPIVCEPAAEKRRPRSDFHCRVSMQCTLDEALHGAGDYRRGTPGRRRADGDVTGARMPSALLPASAQTESS